MFRQQFQHLAGLAAFPFAWLVGICMPSHIYGLGCNSCQFRFQLDGKVFIDEDLFAPIGFSLVENVAVIAIMPAANIWVHLVIQILQGT